MTSLGFTGTQDGMTSAQGTKILELLYEIAPKHVHHGDCIGADEEFHTLALLVNAIIHVHPPSNVRKRAYCEGDILYQAVPYLKRNRNIVAMSDALLATPHGQEEVRSGTWATIRYAKQKGIKIHIVYPDGKVEIVADRTNVAS